MLPTNLPTETPATAPQEGLDTTESSDRPFPDAVSSEPAECSDESVVNEHELHSAGPLPQLEIAALIEQAMSDLKEHVGAGIARLEQQFQDRIQYDAAKEALFNRMHDELQGYRSQFHRKLTRPYVMALIRFHDNIGRLLETFHAEDSADAELKRAVRSLKSVQEDIERCLQENGIEILICPGDAFDPHRQTAVTTCHAESAEASGLIANRVRPGFMEGELVIQKERVVVYSQYKAPVTPPAECSATEDAGR